MEQDTSKKNSFLSLSILFAALVIGGSIIYSASVKTGGSERNFLAEVGNNGSNPAPNNNISPDDDVILGDPNAPVTLIEFGDYQCPFCKRMFDETEKQLREEYVKTGKLKMVYRDFPLDSLHPHARRAAEAAECARDQNKYWAYHDSLFNKQSQIPTMDFAALAGELGLNATQFNQCLENGKYADEVENDYQDGLSYGVTGTPSNFINGRPLPGALPYATFKAAIEEALQDPQS